MPNQNGTGPQGKGPKTGRALGPCGSGAKAKSSSSRYGNRTGSGLGAGRGTGRRQNRDN
ncbi:DUF5320 domain-containing protein [Candidatus Parcubacteria bacterium]|nr:DUF5320 domain-containing protein [Candidatus Parcubacteria bacterium]